MADNSLNSLFSLFAARYGVNTALQLMSLLGYQGSDVGRGIGAGQAAGGGLQGLGYAFGSPELSQLGGKLGRAAGYAGAGYGIYKTATDPNLSTRQKAAGTSRAVGDIALTAIPVFGQFYGLARALGLVGQHLEGSGSPQVRGLGRTLDYAAEPAGVKGLWDTIGGKSPGAAFKDAGGMEGLTLDAMGPVGWAMRGLGWRLPGLYHEPTTGTKFRTELGSIFDKIPALKGSDLTKYNMPTGGYGSFSPQAVTDAQKLGQILAAYAPSGKKSPDAYALQAENILLNRYGNDTSSILSQLLPALGGKQPTGTQPAIGTQPTGAQPAAAPASTAFGSPGFATMIKQLVQQAAAAQGKAA